MCAAFSVLELVFVIVLAGIVFGFGIPKLNISLHMAASSLLAHIRYTQHLALNDSFRADELPHFYAPINQRPKTA